ncbi:MAG: hypothetical protein RLZ35_96 [Pseudomonadota bacterium]|jgi:uncharacterized protein YigA (DUF484 family)
MMEQSSLPLTDLSVAKYLKNHPCFFENYPELLLELKMTHQSGAAISLIQKQVELLRERCQHQQKTIQNTLEIARENSSLFESIKHLTLRLLEVRDYPTLKKVLEEHLRRDFGAHAIELLIHGEGEENTKPHALVELQHDSTQTYCCGRISQTEQQALFPTQPAVRSYAKIPLSFFNKEKNPQTGLLLIGSQQPDNFHPSKDTLFLQFIGNMLERILPQYITALEGA